MAATTIATMAILNAKCLTTNPLKPTTKTTSLFSVQNLPKGLTTTTTTTTTSMASSDKNSSNMLSTAIAGAIFTTLTTSDAAMAAQQIAELAEGSSDNRGLALLLPIVPAIAWVLFNILQPAINQINRMRSSKGVIMGLGLGGLASSGYFINTPQASAHEIAMLADATSDNRGQLLLFVVAPAILWVLYNILQPALNQINRMRSQ